MRVFRGQAPRAAVVSALLVILAAADPGRCEEEAADHPLAICEAMVESAPLDHRSYACFWTEGRKNGMLDQAARILRDLLREDPSNPHRSAYLAAIEMDRGEVKTAAVLYRRAADLHAELGNTTAEAHVRLTFSYLLAVQMGRLDEAEAELDRVRTLMGSVADPTLPGWLAMRETSLANKRLEFGRALRILRGVESDFFPDGPWVLRQLWHNYMGFTLRALGRVDAAERAYRSEAELLRSMDAPFEEAIPRRNLTLLAMRSGKSEETCLRLAGEALEAAVQGDNRRLQAQGHCDLSYLSSGIERLDHARTALVLARETEYPQAIMEAQRALSLALVETDPGAAVASSQESIDLAEELGDLHQTARGYLTQAEVLRKTAPADVALDASLRALDITETIRQLQPDPEIRARHFGTWTGPYYELALYLLDDPDANAMSLAFEIMERMRARTLLDELEAARAAAPFAGSKEILEDRREVLREIAAVQRRLINGRLSAQERAQARQRLTSLENDEAALREKLWLADPNFAVVGRTGLASLAEIQDALAPDQAMLVFQVPAPGRPGADRSWLLSITAQEVTVNELPRAGWIEDAVGLFRGLLESGEEETTEGAARLYERLLASALDEMDSGIRRLVIVPDRSLHILPFGALRAPGSSDPIGVRFAIAIAPSATVWLRLRNRDQAKSNIDALVFADPQLRVERASTNRSTESARLPDLRELGSLPYARIEAESVGRRLGRDSKLLLGPEASETAFKDAAFGDYGVIHLAAHAIVDTDEPQRSGILLAPGSQDEDGLIQIRELTELDLAGQLVILSGCGTASGVVLVGEGPTSLARPFFLAGASTVVGSLWPLPDRAAAELFDRFYSHLAHGLTVAGSLSAAREDLIRIGSPARVWAGVVVLGDGDKVLFPDGPAGSRKLPWAAAILISLALGGIMVLIRQTRARRPRVPGSARGADSAR